MRRMRRRHQLPTILRARKAEAVGTQDGHLDEQGEQRGDEQHDGGPDLGVAGPDVALVDAVEAGGEEDADGEGHDGEDEAVEGDGEGAGEGAEGAEAPVSGFCFLEEGVGC